jgi:hypothetical protein
MDFYFKFWFQFRFPFCISVIIIFSKFVSFVLSANIANAFTLRLEESCISYLSFISVLGINFVPFCISFMNKVIIILSKFVHLYSRPILQMLILCGSRFYGFLLQVLISVSVSILYFCHEQSYYNFFFQICFICALDQ